MSYVIGLLLTSLYVASIFCGFFPIRPPVLYNLPYLSHSLLVTLTSVSLLSFLLFSLILG